MKDDALARLKERRQMGGDPKRVIRDFIKIAETRWFSLDNGDTIKIADFYPKLMKRARRAVGKKP